MNGKYLEPVIYRRVLRSIFSLQVQLKLYASALDTYRTLGALKPPESDAAIDSVVDQIRSAVAANAPIGFDGVVEYRSGCAEGRPNWQHELLRRRFTFDDVGGKLTDFELRCDWKRISGPVATDRIFEMPKSWGYCQVFVFGDVGAKVKLVEYPADKQPEPAAATSN